MLDKAKALFDILPPAIKMAAAYVPDRVVFGSSFKATQISFDKECAFRKMAAVIRYAATHTPYGRKYLPKEFDDAEVMSVYASLPIVDSNMLAEDMLSFVADPYRTGKSYLATTGGTGGSPRQVRLSNASYGAEWAHILHAWGHAGYDRRRHRKLTLRGKQTQRGRLTEFNAIYNELVVNTLRMSSATILELMNEITRYKVKYIHGYPSLVEEFADLLRVTGYRLTLDGIFLGSEAASVGLKGELEEQFGAKVISWYGQTEKVILAADFDSTNEFKVYTSYGYPTTEDDGFSEILGTGFINLATPLVKYRTGDYGRLIEREGAYYLTGLEGRWGKDFVYLDPNKRIPTTAINLHNEIQREILFYQIIQTRYGEVHVKILTKKSSKLTPEQVSLEIGRQLEAKLTGFKVTTEIAKDENDIRRSHRGKMMLLVQEIH